jgi:festuclavine dehydrogenase
MAVLVTGGTGKTSKHLASFLQDANVPFVLASRKAESAAPSGMAAVKFDWLDSSTYENPFRYKFPGEESISAIYLIAPEVPDPVPSMNAFIDHALQKHGVKRFVLLAGSSIEKGGYYLGKVWSHLDDVGVEYCVLLATWFMGSFLAISISIFEELLLADKRTIDNFSERQHRVSIKEEGKIYTACGDAQIPFISALDIAAVALHTLTDSIPHENNYRILGPELLTHDEVQCPFSEQDGRCANTNSFGPDRSKTQ